MTSLLRLKPVTVILFAVCMLAIPASVRAVGTWAALAHTSPGAQINNMVLLLDGTVLVHDVNSSTHWYKLTPDSNGSYVNGTWTSVASMNYSREYCSVQVLVDGRVFVAGGEYGSGGTNGEVFDPIANTWTMAPGTPGVNKFLDSCSEILPNGNVLVAPVSPANYGETLIWNTNNMWSVGPTLYRGDDQDEACWVKLPDDSVLTIDPFGQNCERYIPSQNKWINDASVPVTMYGWGGEMGAGFLLPNGKVFYLGGTSHTAIYTPSGGTGVGAWVAGPNIPNNYGVIDGPAAMMNNSKILCCVGTNGSYAGPSYFYEYDYTTNGFAPAPSPTSGTLGASFSPAPFVCAMLDLPDGSVLLSRQSSQLYIYTPDGSPVAAGKPTINSVSVNADGSFNVAGTLLNGISEGAAYGDDMQMDSNYPIGRTTNSAGKVYYGRTSNRSTTSVATGTNVETTLLTMPSGLAPANYPLFIVANGISSDPFQIVLPSGLTWDANTSSSSAQDGSGTWNSSNANWWNGVADSIWNDTNPYVAFFGNGGTAGTVTVSGAHTNSWITFNSVSGAYTLSGSGSLTVSNGISANASATVNVAQNFATNVSWTVATNKTLTVEGALNAIAPSVLSLAGAGTVTLTGSDNLIGANITALNFADSINTSILNLVNNTQTVATVTMVDSGQATVKGSGTLSINGGDWYFGSTNLTSDSLDMSGLSKFLFNAPANTFSAGPNLYPNVGTGSVGLNLAVTNAVTVATFDVAGYGGFGGYGFIGALGLGQGNLIYANSLNIGCIKQSGSVAFNSGLVNPSVTIRATDGVSPATVNVGQQNNYTAQTTTATFDSSAGSIDALIGSLTIGNAMDRDGTNLASFKMGTGTLTAASMTAGLAQGSTSGSFIRAGNGTFELAGGNANVTNFTLGNNTATAGTAAAIGAFLMDSGTFRATTMQKGSSSGGTSAASSVWTDGTIGNLPGANLTISGFNLALTNLGNLSGTHTFDVTGSQTATVQGAITGIGSIAKTSSGALILSATNTYTGNTTISNGFCQIAAAGSISNSTAITVAAGAALDVSPVSNFSLNGGQVLGGNGSVSGNVIVPATAQIVPGFSGTAGALTFSNNLVLNAPVLGFDLSANPASGNDQIFVMGNLTNNGTTLIKLNYLSGSLGAGTYTLITYSSLVGSSSFVLNTAYRNVTLNVGAGAITLTVGSGGSSTANLTWKGDGTANVWDVQNTANWLNAGSPDVFYQNDLVTFSDVGSNTPAINLATNLTPTSLTVNASQNYTFAGNGAIAGATGLTKQGTGILYVKSTNSYAGVTTVSGGTLELDTPKAASTNYIALGANVLNVNIAANTLANAVTGSGTINIIETSGANTTLGGALSNFTGNLNLPTSPGSTAKSVISSATVNLNSHASVNIASGGTLYLTGSGVILAATNNIAGLGNAEGLGALRVEGNAVVTGPVNLTAPAAVGANSGIGTISGVIGDGGNGYGITKLGAGTVTLSGSNTMSGVSTLSVGQLNLNNPKALGTGTLTISGATTIDNTSSNTITLNNNPENWNADFSFLGSNPLSLGTGTITLGGNRQVTVKTNTLTVGGPIGDGGHGYGITSVGAATLILAGNNTYTGATTVTNGTVNVTGNESAATGGWLMPVNYANTTVNFQSGSVIVVGSANTVQVGSNPSAGTPNNQNLNVDGTVTNKGSLQVARGGYLNINNGDWYQTGNMTVSAPAGSGYGALLTVNSGGTFAYSGTNAIILSPSSGNGGGAGLSVLGGSFTTSCGFTNNVSSSTGTTTILVTNGGTLVAAANIPQLVSGAGSPNSFQLGAGGGVIDTAAFSVTMTNVISGVGSLTKLSAGTLTLAAANTYSDVTTVSAGKLIGVTGGSCSNSAVTIASGSTNGVLLASAGGQWNCGGLTFNSGTAYADFNFNGYAPNTTKAPIVVDGNLTLSGTLNVIIRSSAGIPAGSYPLIKYTGTLSGTVPTTPLAMLPGMSATISNDTANSSIDLNVSVAGYPIAIWAVGNGTWDTTTPNWLINSVSGDYSDGDFVIFDDTASGTSPIAITLNSLFNPSSITANLTNKAYSISGSGSLAGGGSLAKYGANTLTLTTSNNFSGGTTIAANGGILQIGNAYALGSGNVTIAKGGFQTGALQVATTGSNVINNAFNGFNSTTFTGSSTPPDIENVSGTNFLNSNLIVSGTGGNGLALQADGGLLVLNGSISTTLSSRGVELNGAGAGLINGSITNGTGNVAFTVTKDGSGTWTLAGNNTYSGATTVSSGALMVNGAIGSGAVSVASGATLGGNGTVNGAVTLNGTLAPGGNTVGILNTAAETWNSGGVCVFSLNNATNMGSSDLVNLAGTLGLASSASNSYTIQVVSLTSSNTPGPLDGFVDSGTYAWPIATASGGIAGFNPPAFVVNTAAFSNAFTGTFSVTTNGNSLMLAYNPVVTLPPVISGNTSLATNGFNLSFSGASGQPFRLLSSTNLLLPLTSWVVLTNGTFGAGPVSFTDVGATNPACYYRIASP